MRALLFLASLAPRVLCGLSPLHVGQEVLSNADSAREKVPGDNPAYYSQIPKVDQLFRIEEFIVSLNPAHIR